jgi:CheY-like chemotaxis protein
VPNVLVEIAAAPKAAEDVLSVDQGASFTVSLPLAAIQPEPATPIAPDPRSDAGLPFGFHPVDLAGVHVLVVDDQADSRELIERVLRECDAEVTACASAEEALRALERERPAVIVSDIGMPGMDGYELLRRVRGMSRDRRDRIPAVALTAFARPEDRTRALRAGFLVHLAKPVEPSELVATVASIAGRFAG